MSRAAINPNWEYTVVKAEPKPEEKKTAAEKNNGEKKEQGGNT